MNDNRETIARVHNRSFTTWTTAPRINVIPNPLTDNLIANPPIDDVFERAFELALLPQMPNHPKYPVRRVPSGATDAGLIAQISPADGKPVIVVIGNSGRNLLMSWPNPHKFFVLDRGLLVDTQQPEKAERLDLFEGHFVHYTLPIAERNVIVIGHCCAMECHGQDGIIWKSSQEFFCCVDPVLEIVDEQLWILGTLHNNITPRLYKVDLETGKLLR